MSSCQNVSITIKATPTTTYDCTVNKQFTVYSKNIHVNMKYTALSIAESHFDIKMIKYTHVAAFQFIE